jgi:hypothetical protein
MQNGDAINARSEKSKTKTAVDSLVTSEVVPPRALPSSQDFPEQGSRQGAWREVFVLKKR